MSVPSRRHDHRRNKFIGPTNIGAHKSDGIHILKSTRRRISDASSPQGERERGRLGRAEEEEKEERAKGRLARGEKAREGAGQGSHRRLTRNYGFAGLTNKESARETGFARATLSLSLSLSHTGTGPWNRLSPLKARKHRIRRHFGYRPPASADGTAAEFMATFGPSRWIPAREQPSRTR